MHAAILLALGCASNTGFSSSPTDPVAPDGEALAEFEPAELNFDAAIPGVLYAQEVTLRSVGDGDLLFYSAQVLDDFSEAFDIANGEGTTTITLEPGDETSVLVQLILPDDTAAGHRGHRRLSAAPQLCAGASAAARRPRYGAEKLSMVTDSPVTASPGEAVNSSVRPRASMEKSDPSSKMAKTR